MAYQKSRDVFPSLETANDGSNMSDVLAFNTAFQSARTPGATLIAKPSLTPQINQQWSVQSVSVSMAIALNPFASVLFGRIGKILAGVDTDEQLTATPVRGLGPSFPVPQSPLPPDPTLITTLFDPAANEMPPSLVDPESGPPLLSSLLYLSTTINLPTPIVLSGPKQVTVGIWMMPSLIGSTTGFPSQYMLSGYGASYSINYDNGV